MAMNPEFTPELYAINYDQQMDSTMKRISAYYHLDKHILALSIDSNMSDSKYIVLFLEMYTTKVYDTSIWYTYTINSQ